MSHITTKDGTTIYYKDWGPKTGPIITFSHGWPLSADAWEAQMPAGGEAMVTIANAGGTGAFAHPLATLRVTQNVVPLGVSVQRFGRSRVVGPDRFEVTAVRVGETTLTSAPAVTQPFARGQFFDLTDEEYQQLADFLLWTNTIRTQNWPPNKAG